MIVTKEELAARLDGRQYQKTVRPEDEVDAKESGLLIVEGASDDLVEFYGIFRDEAPGPGEILFDVGGLISERDNSATDSEMLAYLLRKKEAERIFAFFGTGMAWNFDTPLPSGYFCVMEDDQLFCLGRVIDLLKGVANRPLRSGVHKTGSYLYVTFYLREIGKLTREETGKLLEGIALMIDRVQAEYREGDTI